MLPVFFLLLVFSRLPKSFAKDDDKQVSTDEEATLQRDYGPVIFSSMLFRHGERYRAKTYATDENAEYYKGKWGQLTKVGKYQMFVVGRWARARYVQILKTTPYSSDVIQAQSSGMDRCIMSAQLFLTGFYPPTTEDEIWNAQLPWQPIPVLSQPGEMDKLLRASKYCSRYNLEVLRINQTDKLKKFYEDYKSVFDIMKDGAKLEIPDNDLAIAIRRTSLMFDNFAIDERYGLPRPAWAKEISADAVKKITELYFQIGTYNDEMKRLKGGNLVKRIVEDMVNSRDNPISKKRFQVYSAHDTTVAFLLNTLHVFDPPHQPPYGSLVLVELRQKSSEGGTKKYYVTILYRTSSSAPPKLLEMPNCKNPCTLDEFVAATKPMIPVDWEKECEYLEPNYNQILF